MTKVSIVIAVYNSHEAVKRQKLYFDKMNLPDDVEFIFVDDGSYPPLRDYGIDNLRVIHTHDKRPWTQGLARNIGAKYAKGEYLFFTDIDHILSKEAIEEARNFTGDKMIFPRHYGVLLEDGTLTQDEDVLVEYGTPRERLHTKRGTYASVHGNTYVIKKSTFDMLGGYREKNCTFGHHAPRRRGEDCVFNRLWNNYANKEKVWFEVGPKIYIFPVGRYNKDGDLNPKGLFHNLSQEQSPQPLKE